MAMGIGGEQKPYTKSSILNVARVLYPLLREYINYIKNNKKTFLQ